MAFQPLVNVGITISSVQVSADGFGTPMFITSHRKDINRVESFVDAKSVGEKYGTASAAYRAALKAFGQSPSVNLFKVGRRDAKLELTPVDFVAGDVLSFRVKTKEGGFFTVSATADADPTAEEIVIALKAAIDAESTLDADVVATVSGPTLSLTTALDGSDWKDAYFEVDTYTGSNDASFSGADNWIGTESAAQVWQEVTETDSDFYFLVTDDNVSSFVKSMALVVESVDKMYFVSDSNALNLKTWGDNEVNTSLLGELKGLNLNNTVFLFHQDAGDSAVTADHETSDYAEMAWVGANAVYSPGSVTWSNLKLSTIGESRSANGRRITPSHKIALESNNGNYVEYDAGNTFTRFGQTVGNEWIDTVRGVHWQTSDLTVNLKALLLGQKGGKVTFDGNGLARVREVMASSLQRGVNRNFLSEFDITMPRLADISSIDKIARLLQGVKFTAKIAGAIHEIAISGTVSEG